MPASAVPLTAFQLTLTRPDKGCERLMRNTAATELSLVTMLDDSNEISLVGGAAGRARAAAGATLAGTAELSDAASARSGAGTATSVSGCATGSGRGVEGDEAA